MLSGVSIIILNYNGKKFLGELLDKAITSALNQTYPSIEVIFVDNDSSDDSVDYVKNVYGARVRIVELGKNYGYALGNNLAVKYISPEFNYILFMNPDVVLSYDYVEMLVKIMERNDSIGVVQGLSTYSENPEASGCFGGYLSSIGVSIHIQVPYNWKGSEGLIYVLWAVGAAMMIRKELFNALGGFSPELFMYYDEEDLCARALGMGYRIAATTKTFYFHKGGGVASKMGWLAWYFTFRNRWLIVIRYFPIKHVMKAFITLPFVFIFHLASSFKPSNRIKARLLMKALNYILRNIKRELKIRYLSKDVHKSIDRYIFDVGFLVKLSDVKTWNMLTKRRYLTGDLKL